MMKKLNDVVYIEAYKAVNFGDDAFIKMLLRRYPYQQFIMCAGNKYSLILKEFPNVKVISNFRIKIAIRLEGLLGIKRRTYVNRTASKCKCAVFIGGSLFIEPNYPSFTNKLISDKPLFLLGANFGPYSSNDYYSYCKDFIKATEDTCFRDIDSYNLFSHFKNVRYAPDILFGYICDTTTGGGNGIFASVMNFQESKRLCCSEQNAYDKFVIDMIKREHIKGEPINLVSFCELEGDMDECKIIQSKMPDELKQYVRIVNYNGTNECDMISCIKNSRVVIGTRFHSVVLGLCCGKPVLPITYSDKMKNFLRDLGFEGSINEIKHLPNVTNDITYVTLSTEKVNQLREKSSIHFKKLDIFLGA